MTSCIFKPLLTLFGVESVSFEQSLIIFWSLYQTSISAWMSFTIVVQFAPRSHRLDMAYKFSIWFRLANSRNNQISVCSSSSWTFLPFLMCDWGKIRNYRTLYEDHNCEQSCKAGFWVWLGLKCVKIFRADFEPAYKMFWHRRLRLLSVMLTESR